MLQKVILKAALLVFITFILDFTIGKSLRYFYFKETSGPHYRTTYSMEKTEAEMLIFGPSTATQHYVPEIFEDSLKLTFYDVGREGQDILYELALLKAINKRYSPKIIILDIEGNFEKDEKKYDRLSDLLPYYENHEEIRDIIKLKSPYEGIKLLSEIYPFNSRLLTITSGNMDFNKMRRYDNKGFIPTKKIWKETIKTVNEIKIENLDSIKLGAFKEFIKITKNSGIKLYVVYSPIFLKYNKNEHIALIKEICLQENVKFLDFSKDTLFLNHRKLFEDPRHLNYSGSKVFSNRIIKKIKSNTSVNL